MLKFVKSDVVHNLPKNLKNSLGHPYGPKFSKNSMSLNDKLELLYIIGY